MKRTIVISTLLIFLIFPFHGKSQGVGLVLSGGGATGFAHIGVIQALEENGIPISYITGTSSGALVGAMYASGYTPEEIRDYVLSDRFQLMSQGKVEQRHEFLLREDEWNASGISFSFSLDSIFQKSLPTNFIRPELLDFEMMRIFGISGALSNNNFDSLFIPFRCVASDIVAKKSVIFKTGNLNQAVRASMTYPFFVNPIRINGVLYFDGGLYNNFPANVMYDEFPVEFIIGSNVSYNADPPKEDDLISQITNMLVSHTQFSIPCDAGIIIEPKLDISTFEFKDVDKAIKGGYEVTLLLIDSLKKMIPFRISKEELQIKRMKFRENLPELKITEVNTYNIKGQDESYVRKSILKNNRNQSLDEVVLKRRYFRTYATPQIEYMYPTLEQKADSSFRLKLKVNQSKPFRIDLGGIVSSRAINTGFVQLNYMRLDRFASTFQLSGYFGKFYGSGKFNVDLHFPSYYPISSSAYIVLNRWDYFRSFMTFFQENKPSFLVQNEVYVGGNVKIPLFNNSKSTFDYRYFQTEDRYYQTSEFTNKDTTDLTSLYGNTVSWTIEHNSLNRKQWANSGTLFFLKARFSDAHEHSTNGSTSSKYDVRKYHQWFNLKGEIQSFPLHTKHFSVGIHAIANITNLSLLNNYTATQLNMNAFQPLPDMQTYFFEEYRSPQFISGGLNIVFSLRKNIDFRLDGYWFQPFIMVVKDPANGNFGYSKPFKGETQVAALSGIYHSPIGPLRVSLNYFPKQTNPFGVQFTYGFIIFNERAFR
jgi:NTE family protein